MKSLSPLMLTAALLTLGAVPAAAQTGPRDMARETTRAEAAEMAGTQFDRVDTNKDGQIDDAERQAAREARQAKMAERRGNARRPGGRGNDNTPATRDAAIASALERFDRIDADKNGTVTADERRAAWASRMAKRGPRAVDVE